MLLYSGGEGRITTNGQTLKYRCMVTACNPGPRSETSPVYIYMYTRTSLGKCVCTELSGGAGDTNFYQLRISNTTQGSR